LQSGNPGILPFMPAHFSSADFSQSVTSARKTGQNDLFSIIIPDLLWRLEDRALAGRRASVEAREPGSLKPFDFPLLTCL
jgi:hypothetical protein